MASRRKRPRGVGPSAKWDGKRWRDGKFWFDEADADAAASFFPNHLVFTTGEWAGQPFRLEDWEEDDIIRPLFGWKRADGTRRYRRCFVWIARKNGKSELAAGVALLMLLGDGEPAGQVFCIASEKDQAKIVFDRAAAMIEASPSLRSKLDALKDSIYYPELNASIRPLSGKPTGKHGLSGSGLIGDEVHEWKSGDLYQFVHDSESARRQPLEFMISTAGQKGTYGEEVWKECQAIRAGDVDDEETLVVVYAPDLDDDWTDEATWRKANPNYGRSVKVDAFRADFKRARNSPRVENAFKRYRLNMWTDQLVRWLPIDSVDDEGRRYGWDHCVGEHDWRELEQQLLGRTCFGGLDLSSTNDLSALAWWFPPAEKNELPKALVRFFKPADLIKAHSQRDKLPYQRWVDEGVMLPTPGNAIDYEFIQEQIYADLSKFQIAYAGAAKLKDTEGGLAIDPWNALETAMKLKKEGVPVVFFRQGYRSMSSPSKQLERYVLANGFEHGGHPLLRRHAQAVAVTQDEKENIAPAKQKSTMRIDGIVALIMAIGIAAGGGRAESIYAKRGVLTV